MATQTTNGKAFKFAIAEQTKELLDCDLIESRAVSSARKAWQEIQREKPKEACKMKEAARKSMLSLQSVDLRLEKAVSVSMQMDAEGKFGDVRDILIKCSDCPNDIGISGKNRHNAIKHSRLSDKIDFVKEWFQLSGSKNYFEKIAPVFQDLRNQQGQGQLFRNIPNKQDAIYLPILRAFKEEIMRQQDDHGEIIAERMMHYLIGHYDFYKIVKKNGTVTVAAFNLHGTLPSCQKWKTPTRIESIEFKEKNKTKEKSKTTLVLAFNKGWSLEFRIHSASSGYEPSLKFDIQIEGRPEDTLKHEIKIRV